MAAAGKVSVEKFRQECAVPPLPCHQGVHLMLASRRQPLYIGGMYRKSERYKHLGLHCHGEHRETNFLKSNYRVAPG